MCSLGVNTAKWCVVPCATPLHLARLPDRLRSFAQVVDKLGTAGEQVTTSRGYARNFLVPRSLARQLPKLRSRIPVGLTCRQSTLCDCILIKS